VGHAAREPHLLAEAEHGDRRRRLPQREDLEGHLLAQTEIADPVDCAHPAPAEEVPHLVALREERAGSELVDVCGAPHPADPTASRRE
jgi:hypothetical protein